MYETRIHFFFSQSINPHFIHIIVGAASKEPLGYHGICIKYL